MMLNRRFFLILVADVYLEAVAFVVRMALSRSFAVEPASSIKEPSDSKFGRQDYWNDFYTNSSEYSWYSEWDDISPFFQEFCPSEDSEILIPGVGNDPIVADMYDDGYRSITAFDYAPESIKRVKEQLGKNRTATVFVADARNLNLRNDSFDFILEKGTLDSIYLSGGRDKVLGKQHLDMAVQEMARVTKSGGIIMSITAACVDAVSRALNATLGGAHWEQLCDGSLYTTDDGFTSNNIDGTLLVWKKSATATAPESAKAS